MIPSGLARFTSTASGLNSGADENGLHAVRLRAADIGLDGADHPREARLASSAVSAASK
jgi:hypothetical protein